MGRLHAKNEDSSLGRRNTLHEKHVRCNAGQLLWLAQERSSYGWNSKSNLGHQRLRENELAIVDGIVGMEGDGPIMGEARHAGALVIGRNLTAVDATCARIMRIDPSKILYLKASEGQLGTIREERTLQRGEKVASVRTPFALSDEIPSHKSIRL